MPHPQSLFDYVITVDRIGNPRPANLYLMDRPDLLYTFTKINLWRQTQFRKIVYLDADVIALRAPDELFDLPDSFAAAPDVGWPDIFNTGVMVLTPHMGDFWALQTLANAGDSFDGADQGLLNQYYEHKPWKRLSFSYNCTPSGSYQYEPAYRYFKRDIRLVHFIGGQKPWQQGSTAQAIGGSYQELLSRWWAVYDRHFRTSTHEYATTGHSSVVPPRGPGKEQSQPTNHSSMSESHQAAEQRSFIPPQMAWDATRAAPPPRSEPEAASFSNPLYEFNNDPKPFRPPHSYAEPPKDMYYSVPSTKPKVEDKPPPIFPWERRDQKPSRTWVEDEPAPLPKEPVLDLEATGLDEFAVSVEPTGHTQTAIAAVNASEAPWQTFGAVNKNAWDDVSGIGDYVRALTASQKNRGGVQVLSSADTSQVPGHVLSPGQDSHHAEFMERVSHRRESLILTDFPSVIERPSLPVTPAPIRRPNFWDGRRDGESDMPAAEGVPDQADWDPSAQLEQLRRNSLIETISMTSPERTLTNRNMPTTAQLITGQHGSVQSTSNASTFHSQTAFNATSTTETSTSTEEIS